MKLYLVQHAESRPKQEDPQQSLSDTGWTNIKKVAAFAARHAGISVGRILHSGKARAELTAGVLAQFLKPSSGVAATEDLEPLAEPSVWAKRLAETQEDTMLVGHLPHLSKLASQLLCGDADKDVISFRNAGIVCLQKDETGAWSLMWMIVPDLVPQ